MTCTLISSSSYDKENATFIGWGLTENATTTYNPDTNINFPNDSWASYDSYNMYAIWGCDAGYGLDNGTCQSRIAGTASAVGDNTCTVCATNKWSNEEADSCESCPTGYSNSGSNASDHAGNAS